MRIRTALTLLLLAPATWMASTPRGRVNQSTVSRLTDGIKLDEASEIVGLWRGCHDGYYDEHHHFLRRKNEVKIAYWVTSDGVIIADLPGDWRIQNARYFSSIDELGFSFIGMLNDRVINRSLNATLAPLLESESPWSSICVLLGAISVSLIPASVAGAYMSVPRAQIWAATTVFALAIYLAMVPITDWFLLPQPGFQFFHVVPTLCVAVLAFSIAYTCFAVARTCYHSKIPDAGRDEPINAPESSS